ncbi:aspartate/glutamate racemase family protein [Pantoea sp. Acro-805]|uniref:Aspartate/glutamate racemase family protein n=1 Tax=Candidatus Pantoea formicae TaxID=2608355 RepID=A0ABX0QUV1_9GAMM|nr:aspartate/glutamate racemase family protein [Pantoea formicae]MDF7649072.1 aspartate/glutamate racemase family protein [Erwiniaceae bacterium L1_54_3]NIE98596.1 aspartate/glutamate racemase family protein [Pantoea formicae]
MSQRIVLLHATPVAMPPIQQAFKDVWPESEIVNLLDDGLTIDRAKTEQLTPELIERFVALGHYAYAMQAQGILVTCSAFGPAIEQLAAALPIPVLKPNEAMFEAALQSGKRIGMLATFAPSLVTMCDEFDHYAAQCGSDAKLETLLVHDAIDLLRKGDIASHNRLVAEYAPRLSHCDAIMLAHFSTSQAAEAVRERVSVPVLTAPHAAVKKLRAALGETSC